MSLKSQRRRERRLEAAKERAVWLRNHFATWEMGSLLRLARKQLTAINQRLRATRKRIARLSRPSHRVIPRSEWGARAPRSRSSMGTASNGVFVHHTVGDDPTSSDSEKREMRAIQNYHMDNQQWSDIGYSFVIAPSGRIYEGRGKGIAGAHTIGYNSTAYGVAAMGNYETLQPTDAQIAAYRWLRREYLGLGDRPLRGHKDVYSTACPGKYLYARMKEM